MHNNSFVTLAVVFVIMGGCTDHSESDIPQHLPKKGTAIETHPILKQLASLPTGISVSHSPNPVKAQLGGRSGYKYTWIYKTNVAAQTGRVVIEEFGSFTWHDGQWFFVNFTKRPFTARDFSEWYGCPNAILTVGSTYSDHSNWTGAETLTTGKMKWYFIGRTESGERVKGEAVIETLPQSE